MKSMAEREKINLEVTEAREEMTGEIPAEIEQVLPAEIEKKKFRDHHGRVGRNKIDSGYRADREAMYPYERRF